MVAFNLRILGVASDKCLEKDVARSGAGLTSLTVCQVHVSRVYACSQLTTGHRGAV